MKKKFIIAFLTLVLVFSMSACGEKQDVSENTNEVITTESAVEESADVPETVVEEVVDEMVEEEPESTWVPQDFELRAVELDYIAPVAHTEANEQCTFIWSHTEEDVVDWYHDNFTELMPLEGAYVTNISGEGVFNSRSYYISGQKEGYLSTSLDIKTEGYNDTIVSGIELRMIDTDLDWILGKAREFISFMGFDDYAEEILHNERNIEIPTENSLGRYCINTYYQPNVSAETYVYSVKIEYIDEEYTWTALDYVPVKMEYFEDDFALKDYFDCEGIDTSSIKAFVDGELALEKQYFDNTLIDTGKYEESYTYYISAEDGAKGDVNYEYTGLRLNEFRRDNDFYLNLSFNEDEGPNIVIETTAKKMPEISEEIDFEEWTDEAMREMLDRRREFLYAMDPSMDLTTDDFWRYIQSYELGENLEYRNDYEGDKYTCWVENYSDSMRVSFEYSD